VTIKLSDISLNDQGDNSLVAALGLANRIIEHSNDSILISRSDQIDEPGPFIIYANETFSKETGYTQEDIIGNLQLVRWATKPVSWQSSLRA
jgi:hypothetical protein